MQNKLKIIKNILDDCENKILVCWKAYKPPEAPFSLISKTGIQILTKTEGVYKGFWFPGCFPQEVGDSVYFGRDVMKVTNGSRKGVLIRECDIRPDECLIPAGLSKILEINTTGKTLSEERWNDVSFIDSSYSNLTDNGFEEDKFENPVWYLMPKDPCKLYARVTSWSTSIIKNKKGFDKDKSIYDNIINLKDTFEQNSGTDKPAYPFELFYGAGTLLADVSMLENTGFTVMDMDQLDFSAYNMEINLSSFIRNF